MKKLHENKFAMEVALLDFLNQNTAITTSLPEFGSLFTTFSDNLDKIREIREQMAADKSGITENKVQLKMDLVAKALDISKKTRAYARMNNKTELLNEVYFPEWSLKVSSDHLLIDKALLIFDKSNENISALSAYGVTQEMLNEFKSAIDNYKVTIPKRRLGMTEKIQVREQLEHLFSVNNDLLEKLDLLVDVVRLNQPKFYSSYRHNRKIVDTRNGSIALKATIKDVVTKSGIKGVKVTFAPQNGQLKILANKADQILVKKTTKKGIFMVKSLTSGTYTATVEKAGFKEQELTVTVVDGERTNMIVELERN
jgi:hypothetical protein